MHLNTLIPVFVLGGFLGSGKTSTLNHILRNSKSSKLGVIVNDFGDLPIDSYLIEEQVNSQIQLSNGCICCEVKDGDLVEALKSITNNNGVDRLDAIFIESSGLADPGAIANIIRHAGVKGIGYGGTVYTLDTPNAISQINKHPSSKDHIRTADIILLNKTDLSNDNQITDAKKMITDLDSNGLVITTSYGKIDPSILFDQRPKSDSPQLSILDALDNLEDDKALHAHNQYSSVSFTSKEPLNPKKFIDTLKTKFDGVYRIKGVAYFGMKGLEQKYTIQAVRGSFDMRLLEWDEGEIARSEIVAIGTDINADEIRNALEETIDPQPDNASRGEMVDVRRMLEQTS